MKSNESAPEELAEESGRNDCLVATVAGLMRNEPRLEAVEFDRRRRSISLATLGRPDDPDLEGRVGDKLQAAPGPEEGGGCRLWEGADDCSGCDRLAEENTRSAVTVTHGAKSTTIARVTCPTAPTFWRWRRMVLPKFVPRQFEIEEDEQHLDEWKPQLLLAALCGILGLAGVFVSEPALSLTLYILAYASGAWFAAVEVGERLRKGSIDVHFLMLAVAAGSAGIGAWGEGATLLFLFSFSGALEHYAMGRTQREIQSLFRAAPKVARVLDDRGQEREVSVDRLGRGMRLLIKPGDQFPVDAEIVQGASASDESNLTGEATPVEKGLGDTVLAGTINLWGAVEAVVLRPASESALQKVIHLIKEAQQHKAPAQRFTDRFSAGYTYAVLGLSAVMYGVWWLGFGLAPFRANPETSSAFYRTMILLVVSSPCALVLSIPSAVLAAIAWGARRGILFRGGAAVEKLAEVRVVALDKTGTLTTGELKVERIESFPAGDEERIGLLAYSLERLSTHPLARAVTRHGKQQQWRPIEFDRFESLAGLGLRGDRNGATCWLGGRRLFQEQPRHASVLETILPTEPGFSEVWVADGARFGRILLRDDVRPAARSVIDALRREGIRSVVLTGDRQAVADLLKDRLQFDELRAELTPEAKVAAVREFSDRGWRVAMVGDGVNDAPSLAAAHVGVAMGGRGADAALEQAEVVLMHDRLENFLEAFRLSRRASRVIRQNLVVSLATVGVLVTMALWGAIPLTVGVVGHEGSTVVVVANSLRLLFMKSGRSPQRPPTG